MYDDTVILILILNPFIGSFFKVLLYSHFSFVDSVVGNMVRRGMFTYSPENILINYCGLPQVSKKFLKVREK